jgi:hypothetical protein
MSWSFHLMNGDLNTSLNGYGVVTGTQKLIQDLKNWILEPRGSDPNHIDYGSTIDGVVTPNGAFAETNIGAEINQERLMDVEAELRRVLAAYQQQQIDRGRQDAMNFGGKNTFSAGEILYKIIDVEVRAIQDTVLARISIQTDAGQILNFVQPVG